MSQKSANHAINYSAIIVNLNCYLKRPIKMIIWAMETFIRAQKGDSKFAAQTVKFKVTFWRS